MSRPEECVTRAEISSGSYSSSISPTISSIRSSIVMMPGGAPVLVDDDRHLFVLAPQLEEQRFEVARLGEDRRLLHDRRDRSRVAASRSGWRASPSRARSRRCRRGPAVDGEARVARSRARPSSCRRSWPSPGAPSSPTAGRAHRRPSCRRSSPTGAAARTPPRGGPPLRPTTGSAAPAPPTSGPSRARRCGSTPKSRTIQLAAAFRARRSTA